MDLLNLGDFLIGLVSLMLGLSPTLLRKLRDFSRKQGFRKLFGTPGSACIVIPVHPNSTTDRIHRMLKVETTMAVLRLQDHLRQLGWKVGILRSTETLEVLEDRCRASTIFFLGSTRSNRVATKLFNKLKLEFSFENDSEGHRIVEKRKVLDKEGKEHDVVLAEFRSPMDQGEDSDYGLVIKIDNHFCPGRSVFWLAGIHAIGTWGATEFLCSNRGLQDILSRVDSRDFATVVKTEFSGLLDVTKFEVKLIPRDFPERRRL